ncbi:hypothetical protein BDA96_09G254400 [Sorghum bicolor]|uniref:Uncharacterized protein n=1 Tax=Sorghum bicolor TaxID=4558 RepID=A0A921U5W3_SORBI|nr:hypothetical protein BDA96_09G254400 [Sorghum bicolor]
MAGIPSGEGSGDARNRSTIWERFPPYPAHVVRFYHEHKDILGEILSGLSHLPTHEMMDALGEKLKEHSLSKVPLVHSSDDEEDEDDEEEGDKEDKGEEDREGGRLKLMDDEKKPLGAEEHQVYSECERECKKPKIG